MSRPLLFSTVLGRAVDLIVDDHAIGFEVRVLLDCDETYRVPSSNFQSRWNNDIQW